MHLPRNLSLLALGLLCVACAPERDSNDPGDCVPGAGSSAVRIYVEDTAGTPTTPTRVSFRLDGGAETDAICVDDECTEWVTGYGEDEGEYSVTVLLDEPFPNDPWCYYWSEETVTVDVAGGLCNLDTEEITVALDVAVICADGDGADPVVPPDEDDGE